MILILFKEAVSNVVYDAVLVKDEVVSYLKTTPELGLYGTK